jgi:uncharacterized protein YkwD
MHVARLTVLLFASSLTACTSEDAGRSPIPRDQRPDLTPDTADTASDTDTGTGTGTGTDTDAPDTDTQDTDDTSPDTDTQDTDTPDTDTDSAPADRAEACHPDVAGWPADWAAIEEAVVDEINAVRARGANCGTEGRFASTGPVAMDADLRCAARFHSMWMRDTDTFSHDSPAGELGDDPWERIAATGYAGTATGENIAAGYSTAAAVVAGWVDSDGHCANLMNPDSTQTGVGYAAGGTYAHWWTQNFGR